LQTIFLKHQNSFMKLKIFASLLLVAFFMNANSQNYNNLAGQSDGLNVITTAVPFMMIGPDARAGGMGDGGAASSPDPNSMAWNSGKYVFSQDKMGFAISYTPWLRNLVNDINLAYVSYFNKIGDNNAIAFSLRYFSLGEITFTDDQGESLGTYKPNEFALSAGYNRKLSDNLGLAVDATFIYSNLTQGQTVAGQSTTAGISVAADIGLYWQNDVNWFNNMDAQFAWGVVITNIGNKISYSSSNIEQNFIPTNLRFGPRLTMDLDDYNSLTFQFDINKLLVPSPPIYALDSSGNPIPVPGTDQFLIAAGRSNDVPPITGMIQSWYDAPGQIQYVTDANGDVVYNPQTGAAETTIKPGSVFREEMQEFYYSFGAEYWYNRILAIRAGYFYENPSKGARQYVTLGVGLRYNVFGLDFSYLIPTASAQNPLQNTLRFSLLFNFGNAKSSSTVPNG